MLVAWCRTCHERSLCLLRRVLVKSCPVARFAAARAGHHSNNTAFTYRFSFPAHPHLGQSFGGAFPFRPLRLLIFQLLSPLCYAFMLLLLGLSYSTCFRFCHTIRAFRDCSSFCFEVAPLGRRPASHQTRRQSLSGKPKQNECSASAVIVFSFASVILFLLRCKLLACCSPCVSCVV